MSRLPLALLFFFFFGVAACAHDTRFDPVESAALPPFDVYLTGTITSNGQVVTVIANDYYYPDFFHPLVLTGGDRYLLRAGAVERELVDLGSDWVGLLPTSASSIEVVFRRASGDLPITVPLPPPFVVVPPAAPASRAKPIALTWDPGYSGPVDLAVASSCGGTFPRSVAHDTGGFTFYPGDFGAVPGTCTLQIAVTRELSVKVDTPFRVQFTVRQTRTLILETTP